MVKQVWAGLIKLMGMAKTKGKEGRKEAREGGREGGREGNTTIQAQAEA